MLALQDPTASLRLVTICAAAIVFFSATQDIAFDAYRTDVSLPSERGLAAAATNLGYRTAAWLASACALIVADHFGWRPAFLVLAALMLAFGVATALAPEPDYPHQPRSLRESVVVPLQELLGTPSAATLIVVVLLFKAGDAFANKLFTPFMMDVGFSKTEIAVIVKALFTASSLVGSVLGGILMVRRGLLRSMLAFGVLQAVGNLLYCALVALIMALCDVRYSAFQYALLSVLALLPRYSLGYPAGWVADHGGWYVYYVMSFVLALPGLAMVYLSRRKIDALDRLRSEERP